MDELTTDSFRERMSADIQYLQHPQGLRCRGLGQPPRSLALSHRQVRRRGSLCAGLRELVAKLEGQYQTARQRAVLHGHAAVGLRLDLRQSRQGRLQERPRLEADHRRKAVRHRPALGQGAEPPDPRPTGTKARFSASIITSARRRCRTSWPFASPTGCSSRCGTSSTSIISSSPSPSRSASRAAAATTTRPACCGT